MKIRFALAAWLLALVPCVSNAAITSTSVVSEGTYHHEFAFGGATVDDSDTATDTNFSFHPATGTYFGNGGVGVIDTGPLGYDAFLNTQTSDEIDVTGAYDSNIEIATTSGELVAATFIGKTVVTFTLDAPGSISLSKVNFTYDVDNGSASSLLVVDGTTYASAPGNDSIVLNLAAGLHTASFEGNTTLSYASNLTGGSKAILAESFHLNVSATPVPEPASVVLVALTGGVLLRRRRVG